MTKIDIISGFLGAGKTTLIKKLLEEVYQGQKLVLIENEFGEIGIDGGFLRDSGIQISEMNSGCICCSLVGDFGRALKEVITTYSPDRVMIEPSGVGKLSDVIRAVQNAGDEVPMELGVFVTVVNAAKCAMYMKNFGEFFNDQVECAGAIILSRTGGMSEEKLNAAVALLRQHNPQAPIITTPWDQLTGAQIREAMEGHTLAEELLEEIHAHGHDHHHHHDHEHDHEHHHDHEHEHDHEHHHGHEHDHDHEHHHEHDHHHHEHDGCCGHDHDADEVFTSWGVETTKKFTQAELHTALEELDTGAYGSILRAKGILPDTEGNWIHFDYTPGEIEIRAGGADYTGRLCVIGAELKEEGLKEVFGL